MKRLILLLAVVAALAVTAPLAAQARHSADDPVGHVRHGGDDRPGDDSRSRRSAAKATTQAVASVVRAGHGRGADDARGDERSGRGADDGPNHR